ncbi:MAG TPA: GNAT family N-acetyltransferase [Mucilaginibacter sp.]|nr:GNAT family N-acetyltransferase [Mucilaginibacter sp.]
MPLFIQTPRFVIREFKPEEEKDFVDFFNDERVLVHIPKRTRLENTNIFHTTLADYKACKALGRWGIFHNGDGDYMGSCLLRDFYDYNGKIELGYSFHVKYWGQGFATEMAHILINYGFMNTNADEIVAVTTLENIASQKVLLKAGMTRGENFKRDAEELAYFSIKRNNR